MRGEILRKVHAGHQGIQWCRLSFATSVWWPGVSKEIEQFIMSCPVCMKNTTSHTEPLLQPALPSHPFLEKVAADLFQLKGKSPSGWLLFEICGSTDTIFDNFNKCCGFLESYLFTSRHSDHFCKQQWATV